MLLFEMHWMFFLIYKIYLFIKLNRQKIICFADDFLSMKFYKDTPLNGIFIKLNRVF